MALRLTLAIGGVVTLLVASLPTALAQADAETCCTVVANPELRRLGRIAVTYPADGIDARFDIFLAGQAQAIAGGYGNAAVDLLPGTYDIEISGARVAGVTVQSGYNTEIKVGLLHIHVSDGTRYDILEQGSGETLTDGYGEDVIGLPVGRFDVRISGQAETIIIVDGQTIDF